MTIIADEQKLKQDSLALLLIRKIEEIQIDSESIIYYNFPFFRGDTTEESVFAHVLFVSRLYGLIAFKCVSNLDTLTSNDIEYANTLDSYIFSKLNKCERLRLKRRELKVKATPVFYSEKSSSDFEIEVIDYSQLRDFIIKNKNVEDLSVDDFNALVSTIEGTSKLIHKKERQVAINSDKPTKGDILSTLQNEIAVFDIEQKKAALNIIDSPQRIRGLAGSGKTIILTMKAALFHIEHPNEIILYTYFTKSLYASIKYLIEKYYKEFTENLEPDWSKIHILHGWGGFALEGVYSDACRDNNITPISFGIAKSKNAKDPFGYICSELINSSLNPKYDLTLIDEGQDFPKSFYQLCYKLTKNRRIVWAYDDFQNIFDVDIQNEKETFGKDANGNYYVDFSKEENTLKDIVLHTCYRNPRNALIAAFSLGLGIYNKPVIQRLENNQHWNDLGFDVIQGDSSIVGSDMIIERSLKNSPIDSEKIFSNPVQVKGFDNLDKETNFVVECINSDIRKEELRPDDICVICLDNRNISHYFDALEHKLNLKGIKSFNHLKTANNNTNFAVEKHVTLSSINKAKGNEVGMVYIIGIDSIFNNPNYPINRNKLFTAITRTKGWVTLTGIGETVSLCVEELKQLKANELKLCFTQPKDSARTILRGLTEQQSQLNKINDIMADLMKKTGLSAEEVIKMLNLPK